MEEFLRKVCLAYELKLTELMGEKNFKKFSTKIAKKLFAEELINMPDSEFKEFCLDNFDIITGPEDNDNDVRQE